MLAEQIMACEVINGQIDQLFRRLFSFGGENLAVCVCAELLDSYIVDAGL